MTTITSIFKDTVERHGQQTAAQLKQGGKWVDITWAEIDKTAKAIAGALVSKDLEPKARVAILSNTRIEWITSDLGVLMSDCTTVPIYQSSIADDVQYIINDAEVKFIFAEDESQIKKLWSIKDQIPNVSGVVCFEQISEEVQSEVGDWVMILDDFQATGETFYTENQSQVDERSQGVDPSDLLTLVYTSGTTGRPKGVMISHDNMVYEAEAVANTGLITPDDTQLLFLPLAHIFAKVLEVTWFKLGHVMSFAESIPKVVDNMGEVKPTFMASVPRIFEKVYAVVKSGAESKPGVAGKIARWGLKQEEKATEAELKGQTPGGLGWSLAQKIFIPKLSAGIQGKFGGRLRFFISGGAPLPPDIAYFYKHAGITILEGYGLTETSAATSVNQPDQMKIGTVGPILDGTEVKIADDGEIMIKGRGVFQGYWNKPEATAEAIEPDGWFHSGDLGAFDGPYLKITGRKKDIIVTAGGKNIAPQNIESKLKSSCTLMSQVVIHGDKRKFLSALVTLEQDALMGWASQKGIEGQSFAELTAHPDVKAIIDDTFKTVNSALASYETIKKWRILDADFSVESGELTPSLKVKRNVVSANHKDLYDSFYND
jgi:long-chain acyl-CoA synthetase